MEELNARRVALHEVRGRERDLSQGVAIRFILEKLPGDFKYARLSADHYVQLGFRASLALGADGDAWGAPFSRRLLQRRLDR